MASAGPSLPPHLLEKRKREAEEEEVKASKATQRASRSSTPDSATKRRRVVGPSLPPAPLGKRPSTEHDGEGSSSSDDDLGPALPPAHHGRGDTNTDSRITSSFDQDQWEETKPKKPQREEWMLVPPKSDDWSSRVDPTKLRNRKFNTGKGAKAPAQRTNGENAVWTETPEQKRKRLEDEVMGVIQPAAQASSSNNVDRRAPRDDDTDKRIQEYNDAHRNKSLYEAHKHVVPREKEDDPSKRAFDKEKDIGGGLKIGHAQRKELLNRAADFSSKFSKGSYL
ncbi:MAG: hypothetical protein M4579_001886 [Chaenotheca gracillima]|nr:MAG: hypothetical protein M4579_001886 [Chaenotheca gracillima]